MERMLREREAAGAVSSSALAFALAEAYADADCERALMFCRRGFEHSRDGDLDDYILRGRGYSDQRHLFYRLELQLAQDLSATLKSVQLARENAQLTPRSHAELLHIEAGCVVAMQRLDEALAAADQGLAIGAEAGNDCIAQLRLLRADILARKGDVASAAAFLDDTPADVRARESWSYGLTRLFIDSPALRNGHKAVELAKMHMNAEQRSKGRAWLLLAQAHELAGQLDEAREAARKASEYSPLLYRKPALALIRRLDGTKQ